MASEPALRVVLCWHMHQPDYRDSRSGEYLRPWVYLHAIKDYVDMAAHLEDTPGARAVVNFAPILIEQIEDYASQLRAWLDQGEELRDPLLAALAEPLLAEDHEARKQLVHACLAAHRRHMVERFPPFRRLADLAQQADQDGQYLHYLTPQFLADLLVWYHLAWCGETVRRQNQTVNRLMRKAVNFTATDRRSLVQVIAELLRDLVPRYRKLAEAGTVELSVSPYAHPILPLLIDTQVAREAMPDAALPSLGLYPGGRERAGWHLQQGLATFERFFGFRPQGCWPSEGGLSQETLRLMGELGFAWAASGGAVLQHSRAAAHLPQAQAEALCLHRPYRFSAGSPACFFRDDGLSDRIGFTYADWRAEDAVADLVHHLKNIAAACQDQHCAVVPIILDGENAWEHYPENGYHFLSRLYAELGKHPDFSLTTFSQCLQANPQFVELPRLIAGSWVYGTLSTWIGEPSKNRAWDCLIEAKQCYDRVVATGRLSAEQAAAAARLLATCEGSDWFWWFGDYNPAATVSAFDQLYRLHLFNLYRCLGEEPPASITQPLAHGGGSPVHGGTMRPAHPSA